jgi:hypothetical protein
MGDKHRRAVMIMGGGILAALILLGIYVYTYWFKPFPGSWNDFMTNLYGILAAGLSASAATYVWRRYRKSEKLFSIWRFFSLGLWTWSVAEVVWAIYNMTVVDVPEVSFADLFYVSGYCFIFIALHRQYKLLFHPSPRRDALTTGFLAAAILLTSLVITLLVARSGADSFKLSTLVNIFYPVGDLGISVAALFFVIHFWRGVFARPWVGLIVFTITDSLYAWLFESGNYAYSVIRANLPSLITDTLYLAADLIMALLLLNHFLVLKYGPSVVGNFGKIRKQVFANPFQRNPDQ